MNSTKLEPVPCPCGCGKLIMRPLFHCQCSSLRKDEADELTKRYNLHDDLVEAASGVVENSEEMRPDDHKGVVCEIPKHNIDILKEILAKAGVS